MVIMNPPVLGHNVFETTFSFHGLDLWMNWTATFCSWILGWMISPFGLPIKYIMFLLTGLP